MALAAFLLSRYAGLINPRCGNQNCKKINYIFAVASFKDSSALGVKKC
jgi:hypothetical protein